LNQNKIQIQGCQKVTATNDVASYFTVITGYKLVGVSDKSGNTIKEKKAGQKYCFVSAMHWMYFANVQFIT